MNNLVRFSAVLVASVLLASVAFADDEIVPNAVILNKFPVLNSDELKQVLFKASMPENTQPYGVSWEIHNPFRDKILVGIVITVEYKVPSADKPTILEIFIRATCGPLQKASGQEGCFDAQQAMQASPIIKLKEVHCTPTPDKASP